MGWSVKDGCIYLGITCAVLDSLGAVILLILAFMWKDVSNAVLDQAMRNDPDTAHLSDDDKQAVREIASDIGRIVMFVAFAFALISVFADVYMVMGAKKDKRYPHFLFIVFKVLGVLGGLKNFFGGIVAGNITDIATGVVILALYIAALVYAIKNIQRLKQLMNQGPQQGMMPIQNEDAEYGFKHQPDQPPPYPYKA